MTCRTGSIVAALYALATLGGPAAAQDQWPGVVIIERPAERAMTDNEPTLTPTPALQLALVLSAGSTLDRFLRQLHLVFQRADADGDGLLTEADVSLERAVVTAVSVTSGVTQIMVADFDGDGFVTAAELRQKLKYQQHARTGGEPLPPPVLGGPDDPDRRITEEIARLMAADTDHDGRIGWAEAAAFVRSQTDPARLFTTTVSQLPITFLRGLVPGKDRVALADVEAAAEAVFREVDANHDGIVTLEERDGWIKREAARARRLDIEKQRGR
jgi:Ca2+-binding EF-hand superfamily protein